MITLIVQMVGLTLFVTGTVALGLLLRRTPTAVAAAALSRVSHLLFWFGLVLPWTVGVFYPCPAALDRLVGLPSLSIPFIARLILGLGTLVIGVVFMQLSINGLKRQGRGAPALLLTDTVVDTGVYGAVRNPMACGFYVGLLGGSVLAGSTYVLLYTLAVIAAHLFNLKCFEESELSLRYGAAYERYRDSTPFLLPRFGRRADGSGSKR